VYRDLLEPNGSATFDDIDDIAVQDGASTQKVAAADLNLSYKFAVGFLQFCGDNLHAQVGGADP
jgi:hypothetical protein